MQKTNLKTIKNVNATVNQKGFTLIELTSVLIIVGVMTSVVIKKFDLLTDNASKIALQTAVRELKARESVVWFNIKISDAGYTNDVVVYNTVDKNMGQGYSWNPGPDITGGRLHLKSESIEITRIPSTSSNPGNWN